jgi:hypothetical protein
MTFGRTPYDPAADAPSGTTAFDQPYGPAGLDGFGGSAVPAATAGAAMQAKSDGAEDAETLYLLLVGEGAGYPTSA